MKEHLVEENRLSKKYTGKELNPSDYEDMTAGYLFELLNYSEWVAKQFRGKLEGTPDWEAAEQIVTISNTLCKIARYPQEYGIDIDFHARIPDGVYVGIDKKGDFSIYGLAEAKLGELDERALSQIQMSGSRTTMASIAEQVDALISNTPEEDLGDDLLEIKHILNGRHLKVKWKDNNGKKELNMSLDLLIPTRGGSRYSFIPYVTLESPDLQTEYDGIVKAQNIHPKNSPFSADEVHYMAKVILQEFD